MTHYIPFIDREEQIAQIDDLVQEWGSRHILCINAPGGIGKTRLLFEVRRRYSKSTGKLVPLLVTDVIDFDDRTFHLAQNIGRKMASMLGDAFFEPYIRALMDYRKMEMAGVSMERLSSMERSIYETSANCFNHVSSQKRILLFFDTTDSLTSTKIWSYIATLGDSYNNFVLLIAGRNARTIGETLHPALPDHVHIIDLPPLPEHAGEAYLQQKQETLRIPLEPELVRKLLILSQGRPILLDLAVEWRARGILLDWLVTMRCEELQELAATGNLKERQDEFERQLVSPIADTREMMDWLILIMARIYPLHKDMVASLLQVSQDEAVQLFDEAKEFVFVKPLPDDRISLHDEMRRMVNTYVWTEVDPDGDRRRRDSRIAVEHIEQELERLANRMDHLKQVEYQARQDGDAQTVLRAFGERESVDRTTWIYQQQLLHHMLFVDRAEGVHTFARLFDAAAQEHRFSLRSMLLDTVQEYTAHLSAEHLYELDSRRVKYLLDRSEYVAVHELATQILTRDIEPDQQIDMLLQRGNAWIRLGAIEKGLDDFEHAVQVCRAYNLDTWLVRALNARGWAYRNQVRHDLALADYLEAYQLSLSLDDMQQTALILNNMGFVHALRGNQQAAFECCHTSLNLWHTVDSPAGVGATYSTLGEVSWRFNQLTDSMMYFTRALEIFQAEDSMEWVSIVRSGRANTFVLQGELDKAEEDLTWAWEHGTANLQPGILFLQAQIHRKRNELPLARQKLEACRIASQNMHDTFTNYKSFVNLVDLAWEFGEYDRWRSCVEEHDRLYAQGEDIASLRLRGSFLRAIADLAVCNGDEDDAIQFYKTGLSLIAQHEVHTPYTVREQINETDRRIAMCADTMVVARLGGVLATFWKIHPNLVARYPEALLTFYRWEREGKDS